MARNLKNEWVVVGIHTHRGVEKWYNSGVCFNKTSMKILDKYKLELLNQIPNLSRFSIDRCTYFSDDTDFEEENDLFDEFYEEFNELHELNSEE